MSKMGQAFEQAFVTGRKGCGLVVLGTVFLALLLATSLGLLL